MARRLVTPPADPCPSAAAIMSGDTHEDVKYAVMTPNGDFHVYDSWDDVLDDADNLTDGDTLEVVQMLGCKTIRTAGVIIED